MLRRFTIFMLVAFLSVTSLSACGKRGAPYRPSEVPTTPAS
ncbi:lipoprotein [Alphaproteobacteria bacterium]|nr:lipoprotein [Alphaproteobacteria bacterium]